MKKVLFVLGLSGSGKSFITTELIKNYPETFYKLEQYTTRPKRTSFEEEYYYITKDHFKLIEDKLMAITEVNGNSYGTIPTLAEDRIAIVIVNALGLKNGIAYVMKNNIAYEIMYVKTDSPFEERENRDLEYEENNIQVVLDSFELVPYAPYVVVIDSIATFLERTSIENHKYLSINNSSTFPIEINNILVNHICNLF